MHKHIQLGRIPQFNRRRVLLNAVPFAQNISQKLQKDQVLFPISNQGSCVEKAIDADITGQFGRAIRRWGWGGESCWNIPCELQSERRYS